MPDSSHETPLPKTEFRPARGALNRLMSRAPGKWLLLAGVSLLVVASATLLTGGISVLVGNPVDLTKPLYASLIFLLAVLGLFPFGRRLIINTGAQDQAGKPPVLDINTAKSAATIAAWLREGIQKSFPQNELHIFIYNLTRGCYLAAQDESGRSSSDLSFPENSRLAAALSKCGDVLHIGPDSFTDLPESEQARLELLDARVLFPLKGRDRLLGWIAFRREPQKSANPFPGKINLEQLSRQAAAALDRIYMEELMQRRLREMDALIRVAQGVNVTLELEDIFELVYAQTSQIIPLNSFRIVLFEPPEAQPMVAFATRGGERVYSEEKKPLDARFLPEYETVSAGQAFFSEDYSLDLSLRGVEAGQPAPQTWLAVPLRAGAETIGTVGIGWEEMDAGYTGSQQQTLQAIADLAAGAIIKARLLAEAEKRALQLRTLYDMTRQLSSTLDQELLLQTVLQNAVDILDCEAGSLLIADKQARELVFRVVLGPAAEVLVGKRMPENAGITGKAYKNRETVLVNDVHSEDLWQRPFEQAAGFTTRSLLAAPMQIKNRVIGVIEVINRKDGSGFTAEDQELLAAFASQAAVAVENATLYTMTDQALAARVEELSVMQRIDRELNTSLDIGRAMKITLEWAMRQSGAAAGLVGMVEPTGVRLMASMGYDGELKGYQDQLLPSARVHIGRLLVQKRPVQLRSVESGHTLLAGAQSQILIPIQREKDLTGVILLECRDPAGCPQEVIEFLTRLADHASIAIANAQLYNAVQAANVAKSEFVSFVAHELKNPMTSIKGYTELLAARAAGPINENQANFLQVIRANIDRMNTLVSDLNDLSKIEAGRMRLEFLPIALREVVSEVERSTRRQIEDKGQRFIMEIPDDLPQVWADRDRLVQILVNLVSNAHKYSDQGGEITLGAQAAVEEIEGGEHLPKVHVWVSDNGIGISAEDQARIFQKFFRSEDPRTREAPGAGLGLNITRSLVEMQGGKIWFESEYGKGTTFHFTVPVAKRTGSTSPAEP